MTNTIKATANDDWYKHIKIGDKIIFAETFCRGMEKGKECLIVGFRHNQRSQSGTMVEVDRYPAVYLDAAWFKPQHTNQSND